MAQPYASSLIESLRGAGVPGATMGGDITYLDFPWMKNTVAALRNRPAAATSALFNPEVLEFTNYEAKDPLADQRAQNELWDKQTGGPTGNQINPVAVLIEANKDRVEPIETGNPVLNVEQRATPDIQTKPAPFASVGPSELENKLMPGADIDAAEAILAARAKGEPDPLTPELKALLDEQEQLLKEGGRTKEDMERGYPASSFGPATPAPPKPVDVMPAQTGSGTPAGVDAFSTPEAKAAIEQALAYQEQKAAAEAAAAKPVQQPAYDFKPVEAPLSKIIDPAVQMPTAPPPQSSGPTEEELAAAKELEKTMYSKPGPSEFELAAAKKHEEEQRAYIEQQMANDRKAREAQAPVSAPPAEQPVSMREAIEAAIAANEEATQESPENATLTEDELAALVALLEEGGKG